MGIWYLPGPAEQNVELTLWQIPSTGVGILITLAVEAVFRYFAPKPSVVHAIVDRLQSIDDMLDCYCRDQPVSAAAVASITQYAVTGTTLVRAWASQDSSNGRDGKRELVLAMLAGRSIDISAALVSSSQGSLAIRQRAELLRSRIIRLQNGLRTSSAMSEQKPDRGNRSASLFSELELTVGLMEAVAAGVLPRAIEVAVLKPSPPPVQFIVKDGFSNPDYIKFALAGTAASMLCYMIYVSLNWPGISTAVTTCALTALTDTGSSRRKQLLRITGASIGGFIFGVGSQVFILPYIDSIVGLIILFACVTTISAYVATSSPRLSYAGLQMALAFYLINFMDFTIPLDLTIGRDRAVGILLGVGAMWLVFERLYPRPAALQMIRQFAKAVRLVASLQPANATSTEFARIYALRDQFGSLLASVKAEAEATTFEQGERQLADLGACRRIRRWHAILQTLFLLELPMLPFPALEKADRTAIAELTAYKVMLESVSTALIHIANHLEMQLSSKSNGQQLESRRDNVKADEGLFGQHSMSPGDQPAPEPLATLFRLTSELRDDVFREPLFDRC
jgi:multidrug resistance protein MdtO